MVAIGIALDAGYQTCVDGSGWRTVRCPAWLFDVEYLPRRVTVRLRRLSPLFRVAASPTTGGRRWLNQCPHCGAAQEDDYLHGEPDVAFMPFTARVARRIELHAIEVPFAAVIGGFGDDPPLFAEMRRADDAIG